MLSQALGINLCDFFKIEAFQAGWRCFPSWIVCGLQAWENLDSWVIISTFTFLKLFSSRPQTHKAPTVRIPAVLPLPVPGRVSQGRCRMNGSFPSFIIHPCRTNPKTEDVEGPQIQDQLLHKSPTWLMMTGVIWVSWNYSGSISRFKTDEFVLVWDQNVRLTPAFHWKSDVWFNCQSDLSHIHHACSHKIHI